MLRTTRPARKNQKMLRKPKLSISQPVKNGAGIAMSPIPLVAMLTANATVRAGKTSRISE